MKALSEQVLKITGNYWKLLFGVCLTWDISCFYPFPGWHLRTLRAEEKWCMHSPIEMIKKKVLIKETVEIKSNQYQSNISEKWIMCCSKSTVILTCLSGYKWAPLFTAESDHRPFEFFLSTPKSNNIYSNIYDVKLIQHIFRIYNQLC